MLQRSPTGQHVVNLSAFMVRRACTLWNLRFGNCWLATAYSNTHMPMSCQVQQFTDMSAHRKPLVVRDAPFVQNVVCGVRNCWLAAA